MTQDISSGSCWKRPPCRERPLLLAFSEHYSTSALQAAQAVGQFLEQMLTNGFVYETEAIAS